MVIRRYDNRDSGSRAQYVSRYMISPSPHISTGQNVKEIMWIVNASLIPVVASSIYFFGMSSFYIIIVSVVSALGAEVLSNILKKEESTIGDGSAFLTGLLLALTLSPGMPLTKVSLGAIFSILIGKQAFGGLGYNIFNPAILGRAFLQVSFPVEMTGFYHILDAASPAFFMNEIDGTTAATALAKMKFDHNPTAIVDLFWGNISGSLGETSTAMILLGSLVLVYKRYIKLMVPLSLLGTVSIISLVTSFWHPELYAGPLFHLFSGGMMLGTFYMATDMVTSPVTTKGSIIFGIGVGLITMVIRLFGGMTEGFMYSLLIMNAIVPLINRYTRPTYFGEVKN